MARTAYALLGPTASGKSTLALRLAAALPIEIVSMDSAQVYRGMDIGTAKPGAEERARVRHHLIDIVDPDAAYSTGRWRSDALRAVAGILAAGRIPLLVGGTMLYLRSLLRGLAELPRAEPQLRSQLEARARRGGWARLHAELARLDPVAAARIHPTDGQRIQRALEVCLSTGRPISELQRATTSPLAGWPVLRWVLAPADRGALHQRLGERFQAMLAAGLLEEVRRLHGRGDLSARHPAMRAVGYRQLWAHLEGELTLEDATSRAIAATRQLAKRQLTWLRSEPAGTWVDPGATAQLSWIRDIRAQLAQFGR